MNITKIIFIICFLMADITASAMKYQIKALNTPTITIDNKKAKVGDWFDDQSIIVWSKDNQAMRVLSEDNKIYTISAKLYKESKSKTFSDFIIYTKPLAARGANDDSLIAKFQERFDNDFIMLDEIVIDLSDLNASEECTIEFFYKPTQRIVKKYISKSNTKILITRSDITYLGVHEDSISLSVYASKDDSEKYLITEFFEIDLLPLVVDWNNEFELGFTKFQQGDWEDALVHLEKIVSALPTLGLDTDSEGLIYYACGVCTQQMGDINQSIQYNSKALALSIKQMELRIQVLSSQFDNYSNLSMENECEETINDMMKIYDLRKDINLVSQIMTYFCGLGKFSKVIKFESDIPEFVVTDPNTEIDKLSNTIQWNTIYMNLALSYKELKEFNKALDYCQKSLDTITKNNEKTRSVIYSLMSQIYMLQGDKTTSLKYQKLSLESDE